MLNEAKQITMKIRVLHLYRVQININYEQS